MLENKQEKLLAIQKEFVNKKEKEWEGLESKHLIVLHLLFELDFYCLNNSLVDKFFNPNSLEMLDDKIEVLNALKDGKKQDEIPKFYDVLEFLNDDNVCNKEEDKSDEDKLFDNDKEKIDEYFETEKAREIENYFKEAMKNFKKDIKKIKKEKSKNKCKKGKNSKKIKKDKLEKKANKKNKKSKNKSKKAKKKNKK